MKKAEKTALMAALVLGALSLTGCAGDYYYHDYVDVDIYDEIYDEPDIIICPGPVYDPHPGPIVVAEERPRPRPLPKPVVKPAPRTKEPERQPRTPPTRTPKPRPVAGKTPRGTEVRR